MSIAAESQFPILRDEWEAMARKEQGERTALVANWEIQLSELRAEQEALQRDGTWCDGPSDMLGILGASRREAFHSTLLAWLLNPQGRHGFGTAFLELFFRRCTSLLLPADLQRSQSACEVTRGDTRADIVVTGPGFSIVIENKVDAGEQPQQCDRIYHHFGADPGAILVFLTPNGRVPITATGEARNVFVLLQYSDIVLILRNVLQDVSSIQATHGGRAIAFDYLTTLEREFS